MGGSDGEAEGLQSCRRAVREARGDGDLQEWGEPGARVTGGGGTPLTCDSFLGSMSGSGCRGVDSRLEDRLLCPCEQRAACAFSRAARPGWESAGVGGGEQPRALAVRALL